MSSDSATPTKPVARDAALGGRSLLAAVAIAATAAAAAAMWIGTRPPRASFLSQDLFHFFYPAHAYASRELVHGRLPLWNPYVGFGTNEIADPQVGLWYPPNLLYLVLPTALALDVLAWLHVTLAAFGTYLLCRGAGTTSAGAAVGAVAVAAGAPLQTLTSWPAILATFAWCPLAMAGGRWLAAGPGAARALGLGGVFALQTLAGYFQLHLYTACVVALFALFASPRTPSAWLRVLGWLALAEAVGLAIAAVQVLPSMAAVESSIRSRAFMRDSFYELFRVWPMHYWRSLAAPARDALVPTYAGVLTPLLALAALVPAGRSRPLGRPALVLLVAAVVLSLGSATPIFPLLWKTPVGHWFTGPYKWTFMAGLALALAAAVGSDTLFGAGAAHRRARLVWAALAAALLVAAPFSTAARVMGALGIAGGLVGGRVAGVVAPVAVGLTALAGYHERPLRPRDDPNAFTRYHAAYAAVAARTDGGRVYSLLPPTFPLRQGELERVQTLNGYETLVPIRRFRLLSAIGVALASAPERLRALGALRAVGVRYLITKPQSLAWLHDAGLRRIYQAPEADVWEDTGALPRAYLAHRTDSVPAADALSALLDQPIASRASALLEADDGPAPPEPAPGRATIVRDDPTDVRVVTETSRPGLLVLLDAWSPDWRATVDGVPVPIRHANYLGRAVEVPAGRHEVAFRFSSRPFTVGAVVSAVALAVYVALLWRLARRRPAPPGDTLPGPPPSGSPAAR